MSLQYLPSPNHEARPIGCIPTILLLHYTGMLTSAAALERLRDPSAKVSCHYLVDEGGLIFQLVEETERAWHAGAGAWHGMSDVNSISIGIEIQNPGHDHTYPEYGEQQMTSVIALCQDIATRHGIRPERVLAHSDVAPARKSDPGEKFDWQRLHAAGVGHWVPEASAEGKAFRVGDRGAEVADLQRTLAAYGYTIPVSGTYDRSTEEVVTAFQRHFRRSCVDGIADPGSIATLRHLVASVPFTSPYRV